MLSRQGASVLLLEREERLGGCMMSSEATLPGFTHDVMAATFVLFLTGPAHAELGKDLTRHGLEFCHTPHPTAVLRPDGSSAVLSMDRAVNVAAFNALAAGDGVFLLGDTPHSLTAQAGDAALCAPQAMAPLLPGDGRGTGLACGFFQFSGALSHMMVRALPEVLVLRAADGAAPAAALVECMLREAQAGAGGDAATSPVMARLTDLLFFYVVRHAVRAAEVPAGLWRLLRRRWRRCWRACSTRRARPGACRTWPPWCTCRARVSSANSRAPAGRRRGSS